MTQLENTIQNMKEAKQILDDLGIKFWLTLGTCLGAYRDKNFCPGDMDDIDWGLSSADLNRANEIVSAFKAKDWVFVKEWGNGDGISVEYSFKKQMDGYRIKVDLWFYTPNPENPDELLFRMYKTDDEFNTYALPKRFYDEFQEIDFFGDNYLIPKDIEGYLEHNYGAGWKTPIHRDNWDYYTDNRSPKL